VTTPVPSADISATIAALPATPTVEGSHIVLQAFFDAYNRHDLSGVLLMLAETFTYGDCNFIDRQRHVFETRDDLIIWLEAKFADQDEFFIEEMIIAPAEGSLPNDPRNTAVRALRKNTSLQALAKAKHSLFKIVLNPEGNRIQYLNTYGNLDCEAGR